MSETLGWVRKTLGRAANKAKLLARSEPVLLARLLATALAATGSFWLDIDADTRALIIAGLIVIMGGEAPWIRGKVRPEHDVKKRFRLKDLRDGS